MGRVSHGEVERASHSLLDEESVCKYSWQIRETEGFCRSLRAVVDFPVCTPHFHLPHPQRICEFPVDYLGVPCGLF